MLRSSVILLLHTFLILSNTAAAAPPKDFKEAKQIARAIFKDHQSTIYCNCRYNDSEDIEHSSCNMEQKINNNRHNRVEWEHMVPVSHGIHHFECGRDKICTNSKGKKYKGRSCCRKVDNKFNQYEGELYNLWPSVGSVNELRNNYSYGEFYPENKESKYNAFGCKAIAAHDTRIFEPRDEVKGLVARASLFVAQKYEINLSKSKRQLYDAWDKMYPPDDWELEWARRVEDVVGYKNPFIEKYREIPSTNK